MRRSPHTRPGMAALLLALVATSTAACAGRVASQEPVRVVEEQGYVGFETTDDLDRTVTYYLTEPGSAPLPLVVYVHGSGGASLFIQRRGRLVGGYGHRTVRDVFRGRARVLLVEKPGVEYLDRPESVERADTAFHYEHSLPRWSTAVSAAISAACRHADADCDAGVLVAGHSEGGVTAARVAASHPAVTHAAVLAGGGPTQLFSLWTLARAGEFFGRHGDTPEARERYLLDRWAEVLADPGRADLFFFGHPFRRWATFQSTSPAAEIRAFEGPVFVAQGTADRAVDPASADMLFTALISRRRDACLYRVEDADHSFALPDRDGWRGLFEALAGWYLDDDRSGAATRCFSASPR